LPRFITDAGVKCSKSPQSNKRGTRRQRRTSTRLNFHTEAVAKAFPETWSI